MNSVGVGYLFRPTDKQLVGFFLHKKATGEFQTLSSCYYKHVFDSDFYDEEPWILWDRFGGPKLQQGEDLYFFTKLKKVSANGLRVSRKVGSGTWSGESSDLVYDSGTQNPIGLKKNFRYEKPGFDGHGCWLMNEYSKPDVKDFVLCRLRKNDRNENKKNKKIKKDNKRKRNLTASSDNQELTEKNDRNENKKIKKDNKRKRKSANPSNPNEEQHHQLHVDQLTNSISVSDIESSAASAYFDSDEFTLRKSANPCNFNETIEEHGSSSNCEQSLLQHDDQVNVDQWTYDISLNDYDISAASAYFDSDEFQLRKSANPSKVSEIHEEQGSGCICEQSIVQQHDDHQVNVGQLTNNMSVNDYDFSSSPASGYFEPDEFKRLLEDDHDFIDVDQLCNDISMDHSGALPSSSYFESKEFKQLLIDDNLESSSSLWGLSLSEIPAGVAATQASEDSIAKRLLAVSPTNLPQNKDVVMASDNVDLKYRISPHN